MSTAAPPPQPQQGSTSDRLDPRPPLAGRYDPPAHKVSFVAQEALTLPALWEEVRRLGPDDFGEETAERVLWHGGLWVNGKPFGNGGHWHSAGSERCTRGGDAAGGAAGEGAGERDGARGESDFEIIPAGARVAVYWFVREPHPVPAGTDCICWQDPARGVWVLNKPAWLPAQGTRASRRISFEAVAQRMLGEPGLRAVHRLDRCTSGAMLFASSAPVAARLAEAFAAGAVHKGYLAWVHPVPRRDVFSVEGLLQRVPHASHSAYELVKHATRPQARPSRTDFEVVSVVGERALVRAWPRTGRTHQIRVHLASTGTPILADGLYGPAWSSDAPWAAPRLQLHAESLAFPPSGLGRGSDPDLDPHRDPHRPIRVRAPLPADWL